MPLQFHLNEQSNLFSLEVLVDTCIPSLYCTFQFLRYWERVDEADKTDWELHSFSSPLDPRDGQMKKGFTS